MTDLKRSGFTGVVFRFGPEESHSLPWQARYGWYPPKFELGDSVKIVRLLDNMTRTYRAGRAGYRAIIGKKGVVEEVDDLPNGAYNYTLTDGTYVHEDELELDVPAMVLRRMKGR